MTNTLDRSSLVLLRRPLVAFASVVALAACANETPGGPIAASAAGNLVGDVSDLSDAPEDVDSAEAQADVDATSRAAQPEQVPAAADTELAAQPSPFVASTYSQYVAFGDSFTSGFGLSDTNSKSCARSQGAWPQLVNSGLSIATPLISPACSGATTQDILAQGPAVAPGYQTGPQIQQLPAQLDSGLITIQIGGNDLKLADSIQQCVAGLSKLKMTAGTPASITALAQLSPQCANLDWLLSNFSSVVEESLEPSLEYTFGALRAAAPNATIVAVGYPHLIDATSGCRGLLSLFVNAGYRQRMNDLADAINAKIASAASTAGILAITDQVVAAFRGHEMCSAQEWVSSTTVHPNAAGHQAYAQLVINGVPAATTRTVATDEGAMPASDSVPPADGAESGEPGEGVGAPQSGTPAQVPGDTGAQSEEESMAGEPTPEDDSETLPEDGGDDEEP